jgi:hypothetical protein
MKTIASLLLGISLIAAMTATAEEIAGVGLLVVKEGGEFVIREVLPGSPADRSGSIHPGDRIVAVAEANEPPVLLADFALIDAIQLIRGRKGSPVCLRVVRGDPSTAEDVTLVREEIQVIQSRDAQQLRLQPVPGVDEPALRHRPTLELLDRKKNWIFEASPSAVSADAKQIREVCLKLTADLRRQCPRCSRDLNISRTGVRVEIRCPQGCFRFTSETDPATGEEGPAHLDIREETPAP